MTNQADFHIIAETKDLIVIDKPPLLLTHPTKPSGPITLWDRLNELLIYEKTVGGQVSIINRLDRETSGLILVAKNYQAARYSAIAMEQGAIKKEYLALVSGFMKKEEQVINAPIIRLGEVAQSKIWLKRAIHSQGVAAITRVHVEKKYTHPRYGALSLLRCYPMTGRTHQIRLHLSSIGHPVIGDKIYGPSEENYLEFIQTGWTENLAKALLLPRQALHSTAMEIVYDGKHYRWESELPSDLKELCHAPIEK
jgi:23S rRNA pseudouridine1911/1915/1917 synthase